MLDADQWLVHDRLKGVGVTPTSDAVIAYRAGVADEYDRVQSVPAEKLLAERDREVENLKAQVDQLEEAVLTLGDSAV